MGAQELEAPALGEARFASPLGRSVGDDLCVPEHIVRTGNSPPVDGLLFELAGPRQKLFFDPKEVRAGIVTCGGLCPGLNDVIRSLFLELHYGYGVAEVLGAVARNTDEMRTVARQLTAIAETASGRAMSCSSKARSPPAWSR